MNCNGSQAKSMLPDSVEKDKDDDDGEEEEEEEEESRSVVKQPLCGTRGFFLGQRDTVELL